MDKKEIYIKKNISDGYYYHLDSIVTYLKAVEPLWKKIPIFFATRFPIILSSHKGIKHKFKSLHNIYKWCISHYYLAENLNLNLPKSDVLLYYSSVKPNWYPATEVLAINLSHKGLCCALITRNKIDILNGRKIKSTSTNNFIRLSFSLEKLTTGKFRSSQIFFRSIYYSIILYVQIFLNKPILITTILNNPFQVWYEMLLSLERTVISDYILAQLKPKVILTNGDHLPLAAEIIQSKYAKSAHKIWFFNELPYADMLPIFSDEVWVWNKHVVDVFKKIIPRRSKTKFNIIGRPEIDFTLRRPNQLLEENKLFQQTKSKNVLLFISEYIEGHIFNTYEMTKEAINWLAYAANLCPNWYFVYKSRPHHHNDDIPGTEFIKNLKNFIVPKTSINLKDYLNWPNTKVVASCSSTGLFVAAGCGIEAFRLKVSAKSFPMSIIDEVSTIIDSPDQLIKLLNDIDNNRLKLSKFDPEIFPYKGKTLQRMKMLCLHHL